MSDGSLLVCEFGNNRLQRFDADGVSQGLFGAPGRALGELAFPWAVTVDEQDRAYVVDAGNNRVQVIAGRSRRTWHRAGSAQGQGIEGARERGSEAGT